MCAAAIGLVDADDMPRTAGVLLVPHMFESFEKRKVSQGGAIAPIVVVVVALGVVLVVLQRRSGKQEARDELDQLSASPSASPSPAPSATSSARFELPGMSLETPGRAPITGDYVTGSVQHVTPPEWGVTWQPGELPPREALNRIVASMAGALETQQRSATRITGSRELPIGGSPGVQFELVNDRGYTLAVTFAECGGRVIQILAGGVAHARQTSAAMVDSFRCTPDPAKDLDREAVAVEVRPGWKRTKATGKPMLVDAREVLVRPTLIPGTDAAPLETIVPISSRAAGFTIDSDRPQELAGRKLWRGSVGADKAAILAWRCPGDARIAVVYIISARGAPLDAGIDLARTGRCLAPGESPPVYPVKGT